MWKSVVAAALGGLIVLVVPRVINAVRSAAWKRYTPQGRGYARFEQLAGQILERIPGEIIPPEPSTIVPPAERRRGRWDRLMFLVGFTFVVAGLWIISRGSDHSIASAAVALSAGALLFAIYLAVSLEKRVELIMADVRRIADAVAPIVADVSDTQSP